MFRELAQQTLKNGEKVSCAVVTGPDEDWAERLIPFLAHKGGIWVRQIERTLKEDLSPLAPEYYLLFISPKDIVANISIYRTGKAGVLGHVFTQPAHRRKGAASVLMQICMEDFVASGGAVCHLGTGYDSPPFHIYRKYGFESVYPGTGFMERYTGDKAAFLADFFRPEEIEIGGLHFSDWPLLVALLAHEQGSVLRLPGRGLNGRSNFESGFLNLIEDVEADKCKCLVARSRATGAAVALSLIQDDVRFHGARTLDAFAHPNFQGALPGMAEDLMADSDKPVLAQMDSASEGRIEALKKAGLEEAGRVPDLIGVPRGFDAEGKRLDLVLLCRSGR